MTNHVPGHRDTTRLPLQDDRHGVYGLRSSVTVPVMSVLRRVEGIVETLKVHLSRPKQVGLGDVSEGKQTRLVDLGTPTERR